MKFPGRRDLKRISETKRRKNVRILQEASSICWKDLSNVEHDVENSRGDMCSIVEETSLDREERRVGLSKRFNFHVLLAGQNSRKKGREKRKIEKRKISFRAGGETCDFSRRFVVPLRRLSLAKRFPSATATATTLTGEII